MPGVIDSEIMHITPEMDRLYGYVWPDTLVGRRISEIHSLADAQITRQYAFLRHVGGDAPRHYVMHGLHPNGRIFRVIKHVDQQDVGASTVWVTRHEPWHPSTRHALLKPLSDQLPHLDQLNTFVGHANVAEMQLLLQAALAKGDPLVLPQSLQRTAPSRRDRAVLFTYSKIKMASMQGRKGETSPCAVPPEIEVLPEMACQKCQHTWTPRQLHRPEVCPRCKNPRWWEPRQRQRKKTRMAN